MLTRSNLTKSFLLPALCLISLFSFVGCHDEQPAKDDVSMSIKPKAESTKENDKQFIVRAYDFNWHEIMLSKLATRRAASDEVRQLSQQLENENRDTKTSLGSLAIMKSIAISPDPAPAVTEAYDLLNQSAVEDFDITYCRMIIQDHKDVIALFENAMHENIDPDVKSWASAKLPDLRNHLAKATECETHLNPISELIR